MQNNGIFFCHPVSLCASTQMKMKSIRHCIFESAFKNRIRIRRTSQLLKCLTSKPDTHRNARKQKLERTRPLLFVLFIFNISVRSYEIKKKKKFTACSNDLI